MRGFGGRSGRRIVALIATMAMTAALPCAVRGAPAQAAASPDNTPLLLVHGYSDTCDAAFNTWNDPNDPNTSTYAYLLNHGWSAASVYEVGYYSGGLENGCLGPSGADTNVQDVRASDGQKPCELVMQNLGIATSTEGTWNDPVQHLGCLLAWYVYQNFTSKGQAVTILAHSMGGLLVRDAIGQTYGVNNTNYDVSFPDYPLKVSRVVTVATPHGGVGGFYQQLGKWQAGDTNEVHEMDPGSPFMQTMGKIQKPQGDGGTFWALIGASDGCNTTSTGSQLSCLAQAANTTDRYPDSDGVVQAESTMAMAADYKVLYGVVDDHNPLIGDDTYIADQATQYEHEINSCTSNLPGIGVKCLQPPFYLGDISPDTQLTKAFVCSSACDKTDYSDLNIGSGTAVSVPHSLSEIASLLAPPHKVVLNQQTNPAGTIGMAVYNNRLYVCWPSSGGWLDLVSTADGRTFTSATNLPEFSNVGCSLAVFNGRLYLAWTGTDKHLNVEYSTNGTSFTGKTTLSDTSGHAASMAVQNNQLWLAWTGTDTRTQINTENSSNGTTFGNKSTMVGRSSNAAPAIGSAAGHLVLAYSDTGVGGALQFIDVTRDSITGGGASTGGPGFTTLNSWGDLVYRDAINHPHVYEYGAYESGPDGFLRHGDTLNETAGGDVAAAGFQGRLYLAWPGTDAIHSLTVAAEY